MIELKPLKEQSARFPEPMKSIIEMSKDSMPEQEFVDFFINLRKKCRQIDGQKEEKP